MKNKSILATLLSLALAINCVTPAFAEEVDDPVKMDTPVNVTTEAMEFSVMVPTSLPVNVAADGTISVADNAAIENNSYGPVKITNVVVTPATGWALMDFDTDVSTIPMNSKKIGLKLQNNKVNTDGTVSLQGFGTINGGIGLELSYDAIVGGFSTDTNVSAASVTITIGWDEATITGYDVKPPKVDASDLNPEDYGVDYIVTVGSQFYMTGTATYALEGEENPFDGITWTSSDESIATVDTDGLVTVLAAGYFDISGEIPGLDEPVTVKYGVPDSESGEIPELCTAYITFDEENGSDFTFKLSRKAYPGVIEYSTDTKNWIEYTNDLPEINSLNGKLYLRGSDNVRLATGIDQPSTIVLKPDNRKIKCIGNTESLLDYKTVQNGEHPATGDSLYRSTYTKLFENCVALVQAPEIGVDTSKGQIYCQNMFQGCINLRQAPELPSMILSDNCYSYMFSNCKSLVQAPELPAKVLYSGCYKNMFEGCTSLTKAPKLLAQTLNTECYAYMFSGCSSLKTAPALPSTNLSTKCYYSMFYNCTNLTDIPVLPATRLTNNCYERMFYNCSKVKLSTNTVGGEYTVTYRIPESGTGNVSNAKDYMKDMFTGTGGTLTTPYINVDYLRLSNSNKIVK